MTQEEYDDEGEITIHRYPDGSEVKEWTRLPGKVRALQLIPADMRKSAYQNLAEYVEAKRKALEITSPDGSMGVQVSVYLPDNGRDNPTIAAPVSTPSPVVPAVPEAPPADTAGNSG